MSSSESDSVHSIFHHTHKRKKIVISDSDSSDESVIVQTRRRKKILVCVEMFVLIIAIFLDKMKLLI